MSMFLFWCAVGSVAGIVFSSFFEWTLHRYLMHRSLLVKLFRYPYERHTLVHHHIFKADHTYHLVHEPDKKTIPMAWWNGPAIVAVYSSRRAAKSRCGSRCHGWKSGRK